MGPGGVVELDWVAEVTSREENRLLAWKSLPGSTIANAGRVRFEPLEDGATRIHVEMRYKPPGGAVGHAVAKLFGSDPKHAMDEDLVRLKSLVEEGKTPGSGLRRSSEVTHLCSSKVTPTRNRIRSRRQWG
jgi:uncharacterized membrane protein